MSFIRLNDLFYPLYEGDIRIEHPEITDAQTGSTFPCPAGYAKVHDTEPYAINHATHICYQTAPECRDGIWYVTWGVRERTREEKIRFCKEEVTFENHELKKEMYIASQTVVVQGIPEAQRQAWQQFLDDAEAYMNSYPRSGNRPRLPLAAADPNRNSDTSAPGEAPNVIG